MTFNWKNIFFLSSIGFLIVVIFLFEPIIFGGKIFGSPDSLSPRSVAMALNDASNELGQYPQWQPWVFSGMPTAEAFSYLSKLYFPEYFFKLFSFSGAFIQLLHLVFAGLGCMFLLKQFRCSSVASFMGSVAFMITPYMITMIVFGHGSQLMTAAYIPWAVWLSVRLWSSPTLINSSFLAIVLGFQLQRAHAQVAYYTWLLIGLYFMIMLIDQMKKKNDSKLIIRKLSLVLLACLLGIGISSLIYLPAIEYAPYSVRGGSSTGGSDYSYATGWSFHPVEMLTFLIPSAFGFGGQVYWGYMPFTDYPNYMGIIIFSLALIGIVYKKGVLKWYLLSATLIALFISFGRHFSPIYDLFFNFFPFFNKFRVPHMILILVQFNIAILAAFGLDKIIELKKGIMPKWFYPSIAPFGLIFLIMIFASSSLEGLVKGYFSMPSVRDPSQVQMINALRWDLWLKDAWLMLLFMGSFFTLIWAWCNSKIAKNTFTAVIIILATLDIIIVNHKIIKPDRMSGRGSQLISKRFVKEYYRPDEIVNYLSQDKDKFRIYPTGQLFGDSRFAAFGLESIGGYHPAKLKVYNDFLQNTQNAGVFPVLRMLNAKYLILPDAQQIGHPKLTLVKRGSLRLSRGELPTAIYELNDFLPRAWFVKSIETVSHSDIWQRITDPAFNPKEKAYTFESVDASISEIGTVKSIEQSIHQTTITTESSEDQFLVLSEIFYPIRWKAFIDNEPIKTFQVNGLLRGVIVPKGSQTIHFIYDKSSYKLGLGISIFSLFISLGLIGFSYYRQRIK
ncbi:MAG: hypothetical protein VX746_00015 [Candidatus Neomarinimicrobiota bacterium]|nr:hypothetical protein [Candidatus Neomarinimicrobiota bacterium]